MSPEKIKRVTVLLLAAGLGSALLIYLTAEPVTLDPLLGDPFASKKFVRELRVIGGKGNLMAAEFADWFGSLWEGPTLGGTVAVITILVTLAFRFVAARPDIYRDPVEPTPTPDGKTPAAPTRAKSS